MTEYSMMSEQNLEDAALQTHLKKTKMKESFNRIGWACFLLIAIWFGFLMMVGMVFGILEALGFSAMPFYEAYMLVFNELGLLLAIVVAMFVLKPIPTYEIEAEKIRFGRFLKYILIAFSIGAVGNILGALLLNVWNTLTNNEAGGEVEEMLNGSNMVMTVLMVGLVAPFLEEFFFRKLLIDRMRPYGEMTCIMTSAILFGLFHGNFTQFFYAAGLGAFLAYIYFRSGNFVLIFMIHAVFNLVAGILPYVLLTMENDMLYMVYAVLYVIAVLAGIVLFLSHIFKFKAKKGELILPRKQHISLVIKNSGMIAAVVLMLAIMILSLFPFTA